MVAVITSTSTDTSTTTSKNSNSRSLSEQEKMQKLVELCAKLEEISSELKARGYDTREVPTWYYSHCKKIVNYLEGFARESRVKPSKLGAIRFRGGKRKAVIAQRRRSKK